MKIPCAIMRGGTSKGIYIKEEHLPPPGQARDKTLLAIFGSPDVRQIDGLGGADPLTSKAAIIGPPSIQGADVDYTFGQISIDRALVDYSGNCGNISSAVGPFAIDEGFVTATEPITTVRIHNVNTGKILNAEVPVSNGKAEVLGNCAIDGVPGTGAEIMLDFSSTAGAITGKLLPTDNVVDTLETSKGKIEVSIVDVSNVVVFVRATDIGLSGTETPDQLGANPEMLLYLEEIRAKAAVLAGMAPNVESATKDTPAFPMIAFVAPAHDYTDFTTGNTIEKDSVDFLSRIMFMQVMHKTYAGTGTACTGAAAKIKGTVLHSVIPNVDSLSTLRIGHPAGVIPVEVGIAEGALTKVAFARTARRIMDGNVYIVKK